MIKYHYRPINFIKIFTVFFVCIPQTIIFAQNNSQPKKAGITLYSGLKLPESSDFNETGFGFWLGLGLDVPLGLNWSLEPEGSYWVAKINNIRNKRNIHVLAFSLLISKKLLFQNFSLKFALGPGAGNESNPFGQNQKGILFINLEISSLISLSDQINFVPKIRYQIAASLGAHPNGESFQSFLIGLGIQYEFIRN